MIYQLVSATGEDRYLALGVRNGDPDSEVTSGKIAGDVTVGWINSKTGKGAVDDYFLASESGHTCSDGAESCPDSNVEVNVAPRSISRFASQKLRLRDLPSREKILRFFSIGEQKSFQGA